MSDLEVTNKELLTRDEAAQRLTALAAALAGGEKVEVTLGATRLEIRVPDEVRCEIEIEVDDDEVELEVELKWSLGKRSAAPVKPAAKPAVKPAAKPATPSRRTAAAAKVSARGGRRGRGTAR
ncbi:MAG TPA: amphi-Trp domain-containing protein [Actinophytocola sp.]|jgi:amphi-Trp domain-containing protein|nr:amphi-Trp domain-containing protein [Actinophytocola sp.]